MKIWDANSFESESESDPEGSCIYTLACRFNHECIPNVGNCTIVFLAARDIRRGEELTISHYPRQMTADERREHLEYVYGFVCGCRHCESQKAVTRSDVDRMYIDHHKINLCRRRSDRVQQQRRVLLMVGDWYTGMSKKLFFLRDEFRVLLTEKRLFSRILGDSGVREQLVKDFVEKMGRLLRANNDFGIEEEVIKKYLARHELIYRGVADEMADFRLRAGESWEGRVQMIFSKMKLD